MVWPLSLIAFRKLFGLDQIQRPPADEIPTDPDELLRDIRDAARKHREQRLKAQTPPPSAN
jgi:hypothetical protein